MNNRYIPYGYCVTDGILTVVGEEAIVIREVFRDYSAGKTLQTIADDLTRAGVEYVPGKSTWNKNRVARIVENSKYIGEGEYPAIIDKGLFSQARRIKEQRGAPQKNSMFKTITPATVLTVCGLCGSGVKRINDKRLTAHQKYICRNPECRHSFCVDDAQLDSMIRQLLTNAQISFAPKQDADDMIRIRRKENEVERLLDGAEIDASVLREMIFDIAAEKYRLFAAGRELTDKLRTDLAPANLSSANIRKTVMETVSKITLMNDDAMEITLINGQVLRREEDNGSDVTAKDCARNTSNGTSGTAERDT